MGIDEGNLVDLCPIVLLHGTYLPVALIMLFIIHTISYICDSMSKR